MMDNLNQHKDKLETMIDIRAPWTGKTPTPPPSKNYGRHCMELHFTVKGKKGAIEFNVLTDQRASKDRGNPLLNNMRSTLCQEVYIHSRYKKYMTDTEKTVQCSILGGHCYGILWTTLEEFFEEWIDNDEPTHLGSGFIFGKLAEKYYSFFYKDNQE